MVTVSVFLLLRLLSLYQGGVREEDRSDEMLTARPRTMWLSSSWRTRSLSSAVGDGLMGALLLGARMVNSLSAFEYKRN